MSSSTRSPVQPILIGVDIGGTKTHLRRLGPDGVKDLIVPSSSWRVRDWTADARALLGIVESLVTRENISAMAIGAHGCDDADECRAFENAFSALVPCRVQVVNDAELMPAAFDLVGQIGLVAGTGSIAVCRGEDGAMRVAGGWGWIIGDEGSAASLVREAARVVADHCDNGGALDEPLTRRLFDGLGIPSPARIGSRLGQLGNAANVGSHAHIVFDAADAGSHLADRVIREGGAALAALVARLVNNGAPAHTAVAGGSVIAHQPRLWQAFATALELLCQGRISSKLFTGAPVEGACRLALRLTRHEDGSAFPSPIITDRPEKAYT